MIKKLEDITAENPTVQVWKHLRLFLDEEYTQELHCSYLEIDKSSKVFKKDSRNIKKQVTQIGYSIRQAEEYFEAASGVDLPTRPLLLYYGATTLARALVLLKNNGNYALDRTPTEHRRHGLELVQPHFKGSGLEVFLEAVGCSIQENGSFPLFYASLVNCMCHVPSETYNVVPNTFGQQLTMNWRGLLNSCETITKEKISKIKRNLLEMLRVLPDMFTSLKHSGIEPTLCKGSAKGVLTRHFSSPDQGIEPIRTESVINFIVDSLTDAQRSTLLACYTNHPELQVMPTFGINQSTLFLRLTLPGPDEKQLPMWIPDMVDDLGGNLHYVLDPDSFLGEPATYYMVLYCLGMLSRYYPHVWMKAIETSRIAGLCDSFLNFAQRKFPNLVLDQMTETRYHIHS